MPGLLGKIAAAAIAAAWVLQPAEPTGPAAIMEALLFGFDMAPPSRTAGLRADVQRGLARYRARVRMFRPTIRASAGFLTVRKVRSTTNASASSAPSSPSSIARRL